MSDQGVNRAGASARSLAGSAAGSAAGPFPPGTRCS